MKIDCSFCDDSTGRIDRYERGPYVKTEICADCNGEGTLTLCRHCAEPQRRFVCDTCAYWIKRVGVEGLRKLLIECAAEADRDGKAFVQRMAKAEVA